MQDSVMDLLTVETSLTNLLDVEVIAKTMNGSVEMVDVLGSELYAMV